MASSKLNNPATTYTINQMIALKNSDSITYKNYSILQKSLKDDNLIYSIDNVIYDYMEEINPYKKLVGFTDIEVIKYKYKPKLFAYDIYGSTECYFVIMAVNGICNVKEFELLDKTAWALAPDDMYSIMNLIGRAEKTRIAINRDSIK